MLQNAICNCSNNGVIELIKLGIVRFISHILDTSGLSEMLELALGLLLKLIQREEAIYNLSFIKKELNDYNLIEKINNLSLNKHEKVSIKAIAISERLSRDQNRMDFEIA